ncbi:MAG: TIGR03790 family protein [Planctomycetales bacterium]|nr:TIGR03790 family protein [Planctomycetales bacterium]
MLFPPRNHLMRDVRRGLIAGCAWAALLLAAAPGQAVSPESTLLIYNADDADGAAIARYYAQVHPGVRTFPLQLGADVAEEVDARYYLDSIRRPLFQYLDGKKVGDRIDTIVTTKGLPLRIDVGPPAAGALDWQRYSSLESELTRIDTIDTIDEMGNQDWDRAGVNVPGVLPANPYYLGLEFDLFLNEYPYAGPRSFDRADPANEGIRLTSRLDAFSRDDVMAMIDRSQSVYMVPQSHCVVVDDDPNATAGADDLMEDLVRNTLTQRGQLTDYDNSDAAITAAHATEVIGYISHGVNDGPGGLEPGYVTDQLQFRLARGAVFHTYESNNARTFDPAAQQNQALVGEWIAAGGTAALGHVAEPYAGRWTVTNEDVFFDMLLSGHTLVESAWAATRQLSYVNTVIGDPLMHFQPRLDGDANLDGVVDTFDYLYWGSHLDEDGLHSLADLNGDNLVDGGDFLVWVAAYGKDVSTSGSATPAAVPEPAPLLLGLVGAASLTAVRRRT